MALAFWNPGDYGTGAGVPGGLEARWNMNHPVSIVADAGARFGKVLRVAPGAANSAWALALTAIGAVNTRLDMRGRFRYSVANLATVQMIGLSPAIRGGPGTETGYGTARIRSGGGTTSFNTVLLPSTTRDNIRNFEPGANVWVNMHLDWEPNVSFRANVWAGHYLTDEPAGWQRQDGATGLQGLGYVGFVGLGIQGNKDFEWLGVGTEGDPAPTDPLAGAAVARDGMAFGRSRMTIGDASRRSSFRRN